MNLHGKLEGESKLTVEGSQTESPLLNAQGQVTHASMSLRDIGQRKQAQTKDALLASIVTFSSDAIISKTLEGIITSWNAGAEQMFGYSAEEAVGQHISIIIPPDRLTEETYILEHLREGEAIKHFETTRQHKNGKAVDVSLTVSPLLDAQGQVTGASKILRDISERKQLNEQLLRQSARADEANRAKTEFLAAMSHEIRTPMNAILGMADLLSESELSVTQRKYVEMFRRAGGNLLTLVNDILDLSKIESGHFELEQVEFELEDLVERTLDLIRPRAASKPIKMISRVAPGALGSFVGDPIRLQQILVNLLGNAVKFTETGTITLTVVPDGTNPGRVHFDITDTGIGIPPDKLESVFSDFVQAESSTTRRFGGTGLGLGICRRLVGRMGGELTVSSDFGKGSSFCFDVLFVPGSQSRLRGHTRVTGLVGKRVLIVDDNSTNRLIFGEMCRVWGMEAAECGNARSALTVLEMACENHEPFDLIIVDRFMGEADGFELAAQIQEISPKAPILMATSDNVPGDQTRRRQLGIAEYAVKPVGREELLRLVCKVLGSVDSREQECGTPSEIAGSDPGQSRTARILIAEDSDDNQFLLKEYLKNPAYEVTFVENGEMAVEKAQSQRFDLILMDMQMPVMDGLAATKLIREAELKEQRQPIPVLALTANALQADVQRSLAVGCTTHISKPVTKKALLTAINKHIRPSGGAEVSPAPVIDIPPGLEAASRRYIQSRKAEVPHLIELAAEQNFAQLRILAHNMKGTGTSYGFPDLTRLGRLVECSAKEQNAGALSGQLRELSVYVQEAEKAVLAFR